MRLDGGDNITAVLRALRARRPQSLRQVARRADVSTTDARAALEFLHKVFGAAEKVDGGFVRIFAPQWLDEAALRQNIRAEAVRVLQSADSSSLQVRAPFIGGRTAAVFCEHQRAGKGRAGRQWFGLPGGSLMMSIRAPAPPSPGLTLAIGLTILKCLRTAECLRAANSPRGENQTPGDDGEANYPRSDNFLYDDSDTKNMRRASGKLFIKWPNDIVNAGGGKVGGILTEARGGEVIVGVGVNLILPPRLPSFLGRAAAGVWRRRLPAGARMHLAAAAANGVLAAVRAFNRRGLRPLLPLLAASHIAPLGAPMRWQDGRGRAVAGAFAGIGEDGKLLLQTAGGRLEIASGETDVAGR